MSKSRTSGWTDNLTDLEAEKLKTGAVRQASRDGRQTFEGGNWGGRLLETQGRFHDSIYNRTYLPDHIKKLDYQKNGGAYILQ